jgi:hypothetical protein
MPSALTRREADAWRALVRRAVRVARQRSPGGTALLLGLGALGGALLATRGGAPPRRAPAPPAARPAPAVVRTAVAELLLCRVGAERAPAPGRGVALRLFEAEWVGVFDSPLETR